MKESSKITVTYEKPIKYFFIIELDPISLMAECVKLCDTYDEAVELCHKFNQGNRDEFLYIVTESKYYTGSKNARFYGTEFETIKDNEETVNV